MGFSFVHWVLLIIRYFFLQRGGTLENSGEMLGWELRVSQGTQVEVGNSGNSSSQMRNKENQEKPAKKENVTKMPQISPGEGLSEGLRGTHGELRELSEGLRGTQRGGDSGTQGTHHTCFYDKIKGKVQTMV